MTANLVLHWQLDALTPENLAVDSSGNHLNGTVAGHPQSQPDERFGSVLSFDGTADAITVPDTPLLRLASYTVEAWLNPTGPLRDYTGVAGKPPDDFRLMLRANGDVTHLFSTTVDNRAGLAKGTILPGTWRHVAIVNDGHTAGIYLDGKVTSTMQFPGDRTVAPVPLQVGTAGPGTGYAGLLAHVRIYDGPLTDTEIQRDMAEDEAALAAFVRAHPIGFSLTDVSGQPVLFIDDAPAGQPMTLELTNSSRQDIELQPLTGPVSADSHHLALRFRPGTLAIPPQPAVVTPGWSLLAGLDPATGGTVLYLASANPVTIPRGAVQDLSLTGLTADGTGGSRGTRVELTYQRMRYAGEPDELGGQRLAFLDVVNQRGRRQIPLAIGFVGGNRVLGDGMTASTLRIRIANRSRDTPLSLKGASFTLSYDVQEANETHEWALSDTGHAARAVLGGLVADQVSADWAMTAENLGQRMEWTLTPRTDTEFGPDGSLVLALSQVFALASLGQAPIVVGWRNVPGYQDGSVTLLAEKSPLMFTGQSTGIGTPAPEGKLQIIDANSDPSGNTLILGPSAQSHLRLGYHQDYSWIQSQGSRPLAINAAGNDVGVGTPKPASRLHVNVDPSGTPVHALQIDVQSFQTADNAKASHFLLVRDVSAGAHFIIRGDGNVGIGDPSPAYPLHLAPGKALRIEGGSGPSDSAAYFSLGGNGAFSIDAPVVPGGRFVVQDSGAVGIGTPQPDSRLHVNVASSATPVHAMQIDVQGFQTADNAKASHFLLVRDIGAGSGGNHFVIRGDGGVGIGTTDTQGSRLCVNGSTFLGDDLWVHGRIFLKLPGDTDPRWRSGDYQSWQYVSGMSPSDVRLKADLRPIRHALEKVRQLRGVRYRWGDSGLEHFTRDVARSVSAGPGATEEQHELLRQAERRRMLDALAGDRLGLIAQDAETVLPELVQEDEDGYKHIRYHYLTAVLIEAIKEQDAVVRALSARVAALGGGQPNVATR